MAAGIASTPPCGPESPNLTEGRKMGHLAGPPVRSTRLAVFSRAHRTAGGGAARVFTMKRTERKRLATSRAKGRTPRIRKIHQTFEKVHQAFLKIEKRSVHPRWAFEDVPAALDQDQMAASAP
ncbi:hypothetical protein B0A55_00599 [Friedmanniomyces simplex]|uniref:Uncharacterized protein n=1 Tax=Friedmanniomyces simplex TaxID=329884 RepID=A0A4U0XZ55_9PEZI|nr:hypothetical protein B0A55_00599 [Friedmanniomyces simplex]